MGVYRATAVAVTIVLQSGGLLDQRDAAMDLRQRLKRLLETS